MCLATEMLDLVERALPRILEGSRCKLEVVLLNNDLDQLERMRDLVVSLGDARVRLLELEHGAGFAKAINTGLTATTGELVFFANSDLFVAGGLPRRARVVLRTASQRRLCEREDPPLRPGDLP